MKICTDARHVRHLLHVPDDEKIERVSDKLLFDVVHAGIKAGKACATQCRVLQEWGGSDAFAVKFVFQAAFASSCWCATVMDSRSAIADHSARAIKTVQYDSVRLLRSQGATARQPSRAAPAQLRRRGRARHCSRPPDPAVQRSFLAGLSPGALAACLSARPAQCQR